MALLSRFSSSASGEAQGKNPHSLTWVALGIATALLLFCISNPAYFMAAIEAVNHAFLVMASDMVVTFCSFVLAGAFAIVVSPLGNIRLGEEAPEFPVLSWLAMLFATGMGSGLLYWGVAEPVIHFASPPPHSDLLTHIGDARMAMVISYLHWGLHPWGTYAAGALVIAYFSFCRGHPLLPGAPFRAMLPSRFQLSQKIGDAVDVICIISTLLGISAALAVGAMQIASGITWLGYTPSAGIFPTHLMIISLLTAVSLLSASMAIRKGIKRLSELNLAMALLLLLVIAYDAPASHAFGAFLQFIADYLELLPALSFFAPATTEQVEWTSLWTANYFLSWISWGPFVGIFVARISRGRSLREFVLGVVFAPTVLTFIWFYILGSTALDIQLGGMHNLAADVMADTGAGLFSLLSLLPHAEWLYWLVILLVFIFLATSTDSASYVLAMMSERGEENPSAGSKLFWGLAIALLALAPLYAGSGIHSVRALFSFAGIAVFLILIAQLCCFCLELAQRNNAGDD